MFLANHSPWPVHRGVIVCLHECCGGRKSIYIYTHIYIYIYIIAVVSGVYHLDDSLMAQWAHLPGPTELAHPIQCHDDVIKWKRFPRCWPFVMGNPPVTGGFPSQRDSNAGFDVFFNVCLNKRLNKQTRRWWFETPSRSLWRHCNFYSPRAWLLFDGTSTVVSWQRFSAVQTVQSGRVVSRAGRVLARDTHPGTSPTVCPWISSLPWVPVL